jgi:uncharacterized damage-inducible protein DinB
MTQLAKIKSRVNYTLKYVMKTFDKAVLLIPPDKLDWKPAKDALTAAQVGIHVYQNGLIYMTGTLKGEFTDDDYNIIPFDYKNIKSSTEILEYGTKVKTYINENLDRVTEEDMSKLITYHCWGGLQVTGAASLSTILEETIHHRGQLCVYLRILEIKPPFIYDYS